MPGKGTTADRRPVGRPPIGPRVDFRVPEETDARVRCAAERCGMTVDAMYRYVVETGLSQLAPV